jgi:hypothetical protein
MPRAVATAVVGVVLAISACSGGGGNPIAATKTCALLAQLARTGDAVASADVTDPVKFDATLRRAVGQYVRAARKLRDEVPARLRDDVDRLVAAVQQYRFEDAMTARADLDAYAGVKCGTTTSTSSG